MAQVKCIVRGRGSQSAEARLRAVWAGPVFRRHPVAVLQNKVEVIDADLAAPQCGLSDEQRASLARCAACRPQISCSWTSPWYLYSYSL